MIRDTEHAYVVMNDKYMAWAAAPDDLSSIVHLQARRQLILLYPYQTSTSTSPSKMGYIEDPARDIEYTDPVERT